MSNKNIITARMNSGNTNEAIIIYVLELEQGKYYVGRTIDVKKRWKEHKLGIGAKWTKIYKPKQIIDIKYNADCFDEDKYVKIYMDKYGIDNVRGGSYSSIKLTYEKNILAKEIKTAKNQCFECGGPLFGPNGHFEKNCPSKKNSKKKSLAKIKSTQSLQIIAFLDNNNSSNDDDSFEVDSLDCGDVFDSLSFDDDL